MPKEEAINETMAKAYRGERVRQVALAVDKRSAWKSVVVPNIILPP